MGTPVNKIKQMSSGSMSEEGGDLFENTMKELGADSDECKMADNASLASSETTSTNNQAIINNALKKDTDVLSSIEANEQAEKMVEQILNNKPKRTGFQRVVDEIREPLLVVILFVLFNTGFFSKLLLKYLPGLLGGPNGTLNYIGLVAHGLIFGLVFYSLKKLLS
jgi:uncharacterized membrane protein YjjP (DUF1212 family)